MKHKVETKYAKLLSWVDGLPNEKEFRFREASTATGLPRISVNIIILPLVKLGLINCRPENNKVKNYRKSENWNLEKAMQANYERLRIKAQKKKELKSKI